MKPQTKTRIKRFIALGLLAHCMVCVAAPAPALAEEPRVIMEENFESGKSGTTPSGWSLDKPEVMLATIEAGPNGGQALLVVKELKGEGAVLSGPKLMDVPESGILYVKASVMATDMQAIGTFLFQTPGGENHVMMNVGRTPALIGENIPYQKLSVTFEPNQWVNLIFRIDLDARTYDVFVDGEKVASKVSFGDNHSSRKSFQIQFAGVSTSKGMFLLDNLAILEGEIDPAAAPSGAASNKNLQ